MKRSQLIDLATRRKYIEAYFQCLNPITLFGTHSLTPSSFDRPTTTSRLCQYNVILATSLRSFGAPRNVYQTFINKAADLATDIMTEFSFDAALGFHFLSYYYWGEEANTTAHYRDIVRSICKCAIMKPENSGDFDKLAFLQILSLGIDKMQFQVLEDALNEVKSQKSVADTSTLHPMVEWAKVHFVMDNYLLVEPNTNRPRKKLTPAAFNLIQNALNTVQINFQTSLRYDSSKNLVNAMCAMIRVLLFYYSDFKFESFRELNSVLDKFDIYPYMIRMGGAQFVAVFHSVFVVAFRESKYEIASRLNQLQLAQADLFPCARNVAEHDKSLLGSILESGYEHRNLLMPSELPQELELCSRINVTTEGLLYYNTL